MSLLMRLAGRVLSLQRKPLESVDEARKIGELPRNDAPIPRSLARACSVAEREVGGIRVRVFEPRHDPSPQTLIYLHGGAYVNAILKPHWDIIGAIIRSTGATVWVPSYGLAPEFHAADAYTALETVLSQAHHPGRPLYLAGDSAGGGLALGLSLAARGTSSPPVAGIYLFSPWVDVTMSNPAARALEKSDVMLGIDGLAYWGAQWAGNWDTEDPLVSPIFDSLENLPPTYIYQGERDLFLPDVERFVCKAADAGSPVTLTTYADGFHVFVGLTISREGRDVFADIARTMHD